MKSRISLQIKTRLGQFRFDVHPEMTARQITQLICASTILHHRDNQSHQDTHLPISVVANSTDLLSHYLLVSTNATLSQISSLQTTSSDQTTSQLNSCFSHPTKPSSIIHLRTIYQAKLKEKKGQSLCFQLDESREDSKLDIFRQVVFNDEDRCFVEKIKITKASFHSFEDLQQVILMKQRLLALAIHRIDIFGELLATGQDKECLYFEFKYIPSITLQEVANSLEIAKRQLLAEKIWLFILQLRTNGYEQFMLKIAKQQEVASFLGKLNVDINGNLKIDDLLVVLQQSVSPAIKLTLTDENNLVCQIRHFLFQEDKIEPRNSCCKPFQHPQKAQKPLKQAQTILGTDQFSRLFKRPRPASAQEMAANWRPSSNFFVWRRECIREINGKSMLDGTTVKKQARVNCSLRESKTRKGQEEVKPTKKKQKTKNKRNNNKAYNYSYLA